MYEVIWIFVTLFLAGYITVNYGKDKKKRKDSHYTCGELFFGFGNLELKSFYKTVKSKLKIEKLISISRGNLTIYIFYIFIFFFILFIMNRWLFV